jgi:hypothetical protein
MSRLTLYYQDVPLLGDSNMFNKDVKFGQQTILDKSVDVAFVNGIRLERPAPGIGTDWDRTHTNGWLDISKYAKLIKDRVLPIFNQGGNKKYWFTPFGLGIYAEQVKNEDKIILQKAWVIGIIAASIESKVNLENLYIPVWFKFGNPKIVELWRELISENNILDPGHLQDCVNSINGDWVAIIPGDPVALVGNEAALGMLKASGDPFSLSYLAYLPIDNTNELGITIGPYHWECENRRNSPT